MTLIVKDVPNGLSYDELYDYFSDFGRINDFRIKYNYGYLCYNNLETERKVFNTYHKVSGYKLVLDRVNQNDTVDRCIRCPVHCAGRDREYSSRAEERYGSGERTQRGGHPLDKFKVVLDNIPECNVIELKDFVRSFRLDPVYARITQSGQHGIVEFGSIEAKEDALKILDNVTFKNTQIGCRPYYTRERRNFESDDGYRRREYAHGQEGPSQSKESMGEKSSQMEKEELCDDLKGWNENIIDNGKK